MEQDKLPQTATVRVPLTVEDRAAKAGEMARLIARIEGIETEAKEQAAEFRDEIKGLEAELRALAAGVREGVEERAQMDLTFTQAEAAKALAGVGTAACTCEGPDVKAGEIAAVPPPNPTCPVHGVGMVACSCAGGPEAEIKDSACPVHGVETRGENPAVDEQGPIPVDGAEAAADFVIPEDAAVEMLANDLEAAGVVPEVETIAPETPPVVDEFIKAQKSRRRRRAEA